MVGVGTPPGGVAAQRSRRREELLDAAIEAIRIHGPGATMEQLARGGGVTKPILYRHFGDRDGLIEAIAERFSADLMLDVSSHLRVGTEPRAVVVATVEAYVGFLEREPELYGFLVQQPHPRPEHRTPLGPLVEVIGPQIAAVARTHLQAAGDDGTKAEPWAYGMIGLVHQATHWWLRDRTLPRDRFVAHVVDLVWGGVSASVGSGR